MSTSIPAARSGTAVHGDTVLRKVQRSVLPAAFLLYMFNYMDRASIGYAQLQMSTDLGISLATYGTIAAIFFVAYTVLEVPSNIIMKKVGARIWLARIAISWGIITMLTGFVQNTTQLYIARIALGVAEAGLFPGLLLYMTFWFRSQDRSRGIAGFSLAQPVALLIGSATAGVILDHVHWFGLAGWQWVFILQGLPPVLLGVWVLLYLADRPNKARWLSKDEAAWLEGEISKEYDAEDDGHMEISLDAVKNPKILYLAFINLLYAVGLYGMTFFLPQLVAQLNPGYSSTNIGLVGAIPYVCGAIAMLLVARYSDLLGNRKPIVMTTLAVAVLGLVVTMVFKETPSLGMIGLCLLAVGVFSYLGPFWALASEALTRSQTAVGLATINAIAAAGGFFGPFVIGKTAAADDVIFSMIFPAACMALAIVLLIWVKPDKGTPAAVTEIV
ncbi:MFS transporter [Pimelobacter simplex]|uniref:Nitrate/nitrite transporter n=1 Tax=Nocardioides simplex TaxID=2045 RepID=A0A0C5XBH4_NOCSI|nr:MFS transporter [Pimelobacter simplex]AJR18635.1 Nitrate/nitrite transporter [Pimelobacter simplex]MCG8153377.1 MFS transporter [Pimelobacter simplex]GEB14092.1 MFS transporter [Pimelobacter simplex]SFM33995.1 MFS transporter, ACS family, tartrate transporter [Pimelobacter simplex]